MKIKKKAIIKTKLIPEIKTVAPQVNISKIDRPMYCLVDQLRVIQQMIITKNLKNI